MSEFSELIKNFDKVRDYMRDFFIYGFKTRSDFQYKSLRTYDNEKRRIESWLGNLIRFDSSKKGKQIAISLDSGQLNSNPLYKAHKSKSFTDNDIRLHYFILDLLKNKTDLSVEEITDGIYDCYGVYFEPQIIRLKLKEYVSEGILLQRKSKKALLYSLSKDYPETFSSDKNGFIDAITYFSETAPFGVVGSYLLDQLNAKNDLFLYKHNFIVHTLEDHILLSLLNAMDEKCLVEIKNYGKKKNEVLIKGIPLNVFVSSQTGRRYIAMYLPSVKRFNSFRLDYIKSVEKLEVHEKYDYFKDKFEVNIAKCWGVSFGSINRTAQYEEFKMIIYIDEDKEQFILNRLKREGRNGVIERVCDNTYSYTVQVFDINEMMHWVKTFIGRIISIEGSNEHITRNFYHDINRMKKLYNKEN
ncbi:MAG: protein-containing protein [Anaerocolumna sp.]|jgi:hypothetical protein|nr:protein-containing protein [Anaerocolumna sp.]